MATPLQGLVHGKTVILDDTVPPLDGKRVLVVLEPVEESVIARDQNAEAWRAWVETGEQGPIDDDGEPELP